MLEKFFDFAKREKQIYQKWEKAGVFRLDAGRDGAAKEGDAKKDGAPVFNITMPPPNANGELHIGHCYGYTVMDILGRFHRLMGEQVLLLPGKDHAGIQTQVVFERKLREEGLNVEAMPREEFYQRCYDFCIDRARYMRDQEKLMGVSADFEREIFTLDPRVSEVVMETFEKLWRDGLVYRGSRMVHWSVYSQTSISDVEVEYKEEKGHLWHIKYPLMEAVKAPERKRVMLSELEVELHHNSGNHMVIVEQAAGRHARGTALAAGERKVEAHELGDLKIGEVVVKITKKDDVDIERDYVIFEIRKMRFEDLSEKDQEKYSEVLRSKMEVMGEFWLLDLVPDLDQKDAIVVATTRPETMLGDTAVAVHPADPRYTHLIGKKVRVPMAEREIEIIADDRIDIGFGTGAVKITPAHDFLDNEIGRDHKLEEIQVIDKFGKMTGLAGKKYDGMKIMDCRAQLVKDLEESGELLLTEEIVHKVPIAERGKDIIEPLISKQWFLAVDKPGNSLKKRALELLNSGRIKVYPARSQRMIAQWLENLNDWNISRQILWGHRMPVWYLHKDQANEEIKVGDLPSGDGWEQETDTFDTWFSSGQWPFSTLATTGLLDLENPTESAHFPTHTMVMGRDILFFWACRMMLLTSYRMDDIPWKNIYFTGLIRDAKGQKMSKSKGNGIEPTEMLAKYGADALRVGLIAGSSAGQDVKFNEKKVESYAKFVNKIWNAAKLVEMKVEGKYDLEIPDFSKLKLNSSKWILNALEMSQNFYTERMAAYDFNGAFEEAYNFAWNTFCSWYLEIAKIQLDLVKDFREDVEKKNLEVVSDTGEEIQMVMVLVFKGVLQMLHPFMPFFTEEIYEKMGRLGGKQMLAQTTFEKINGLEKNKKLAEEARDNIYKLTDVVTAARATRKVLGKSFLEKLVVDFQFKMDAQGLSVLEKMANVEKSALQNKEAIISGPYNSGLILVKATTEEKAAFKSSLEKSLVESEKELKILEKILTPGFKAKADPELVAERENQFKTISAEVAGLRNELANN